MTPEQRKRCLHDPIFKLVEQIIEMPINSLDIEREQKDEVPHLGPALCTWYLKVKGLI